MGVLETICIFSLLIGVARASVYSCEEVKYKILNTNFEETARYVCLVPEEGYSGSKAFESIFVRNDKTSASFADVLKQRCISWADPYHDEGPWQIVSDASVDLDCTREFSLILTEDMSVPDGIIVAGSQAKTQQIGGPYDHGEVMIVSPQTGIRIQIMECSLGVTLYTGTTNIILAQWNCEGNPGNIPEWIISFDSVIKIACDPGALLRFTYSTHDSSHVIRVTPTSLLAVMSSEISDNLQNLHPEKNFVDFDAGVEVAVYVSGQFEFDERYEEWVFISGSGSSGSWGLGPFRNGTVPIYTLQASTLHVAYNSRTVAAEDLWDSKDKFVVYLALGVDATTTQSVQPSKQSTPSPITPTDQYCQCALDKKFGMPDGWDSTEIWLDVIIILDTSEAMGEQALVDASTLIESFIGSDEGDVLTTDTTAKFYTRVGLIAMSDKAEVLYNLNMTKNDQVNGKLQIKKGVAQINVLDAFDAAFIMFNDGLTSRPERVNTRQVIYYMTDSDPKTNLEPINAFKTSQGIVIVNNFIEKGGISRPGLKDLASDGYYYDDIQDNYMETIQLFCKANCFCGAENDAYAGLFPDPAVNAAGGCFHAAPIGVPFSKARSNCASLGGGLLTSLHDDNKAVFVQQLLEQAAPKSNYFWIGYTRSDDGVWKWEDQSTNPYTNWDVDEPNPNAVAKCAYVDMGTLLWGAGNCNTGFTSVCEFAPCSVGNDKC